MEDFVQTAVLLGGEIALIAVAAWQGFKRKAMMVAVAALAAAMFFVDEAVKAV